MAPYTLTWITENLAVGYAPMSYDELASIREQGIDAIVNLCGEFCDLHEIEQAEGFEVFFLPIPDETAPDMAAMEKALEWLDESVYLGKKVLVHCRHGIGRTGTFVTAYLLRRGFDLKKAGKLLRSTKANPTNYYQWRLLRKFGKKEGRLNLGEPTPENRVRLDLSEFFSRYEKLLEKVETLAVTVCFDCCRTQNGGHSCGSPFTFELIEALYLNDKINTTLSSDARRTVIEQAADVGRQRKEQGAENVAGKSCALCEAKTCLLYKFRPVRCRIRGVASKDAAEINRELTELSRQVFWVLFGDEIDVSPPAVNCSDIISGKFIQYYFHYLLSRKEEGKGL